MTVEPAAPATPIPAMQRVRGHAHVSFARQGETTRLKELGQSGSAKIRLPKTHGTPPVAVFLNTAGGLTGGDRLAVDIAVDDAAHAIVTSQTAERAYRSAGGSAKVTGHFTVGADATLEWLPQETILFEASGLARRVDADLAANARLLMLESVVLGRKAMGEKLGTVLFRDRWRIRRNGRLVFADDIRFDGDPGRFLKGRATGAEALAVATLADCDPDAEDRLPLARSLLEDLPAGTTRAAASSWNGVLVARFVAGDSRDLRNALTSFLTRYRSADLPRVWHC